MKNFAEVMSDRSGRYSYRSKRIENQYTSRNGKIYNLSAHITMTGKLQFSKECKHIFVFQKARHLPGQSLKIILVFRTSIPYTKYNKTAVDISSHVKLHKICN